MNHRPDTNKRVDSALRTFDRARPNFRLLKLGNGPFQHRATRWMMLAIELKVSGVKSPPPFQE